MRLSAPRSAAVATALCCSAALLHPATAAGASTGDRLHRSELPTHAQVARIYDGLSDGRREIYNRDVETLVRDSGCTGFLVGEPAAFGKSATYLTKGGGSLYEQGLEDPMVHVQKFATRKLARAQWEAASAADAACEGEHGDADFSTSVKLRPVPELADGGTYGLREHPVYTTFEGDVVDYRMVQVRAWQGRYLITAEARSTTSRPIKMKAVKLVRTTLRRIG